MTWKIFPNECLRCEKTPAETYAMCRTHTGALRCTSKNHNRSVNRSVFHEEKGTPDPCKTGLGFNDHLHGFSMSSELPITPVPTFSIATIKRLRLLSPIFCSSS